MSVRRGLFASVVIALSLTGPVSAETINGALAKAYKLNSAFNSARAGVRATDENVPLAKSGYRPTIGAQGCELHVHAPVRWRCKHFLTYYDRFVRYPAEPDDF